MALMRLGALCVVLVVLSSASTDGDTPTDQYQKGFASGKALAGKRGQEAGAAVKDQVEKLEATAEVKEVKIATLDGQAAAAGGQLKDVRSKIATKDAKISKLKGLHKPLPPQECALYKAPKKKSQQLKLKRTMDERVTRAVKALKSNPEFQKWVQEKPMDDLRTAKLLRNTVFKKYRAAEKRTTEVNMNYEEIRSAMFGRARGLVSNRMSFSKALVQFNTNANLKLGKSFAVYTKVMRSSPTFNPVALIKKIRLMATETAKLMLNMQTAMEIRSLPGNAGFGITVLQSRTNFLPSSIRSKMTWLGITQLADRECCLSNRGRNIFVINGWHFSST